MTEKELEALAREYAESTAIDIEECLLTEHGAFHAFQWLSERYEIVAKEKIREAYHECNLFVPDDNKIETTEDTVLVVYFGKKLQLEQLFPQTLKSEEK